jgi:peptide/nickel transport system ATP-binding protein
VTDPAGSARSVAAEPALEASGLPVGDHRGRCAGPAAGEILGLVGESGSGKTTTARSLFGYHDRGVRMTSGSITVAAAQLTTPQEFQRARGRKLSYVPQNPGTSLNPSLRILAAIEDVLRANALEPASPAERASAATACDLGPG